MLHSYSLEGYKASSIGRCSMKDCQAAWNQVNHFVLFETINAGGLKSVGLMALCQTQKGSGRSSCCAVPSSPSVPGTARSAGPSPSHRQTCCCCYLLGGVACPCCLSCQCPLGPSCVCPSRLSCLTCSPCALAGAPMLASGIQAKSG